MRERVVMIPDIMIAIGMETMTAMIVTYAITTVMTAMTGSF